MKTKQAKRNTPEQSIRKLREAEGMLTARQTVGQVVQSLTTGGSLTPISGASSTPTAAANRPWPPESEPVE